MKARVLVTGATGAIGPTLVNALVKQGYAVTTYSLHTPNDTLWPTSVTTIQGDITNANALKQAMAGIDIVFHLAARLHIENPSPETDHLFETINIEGTRQVVAAAEHCDVKRLVYFSTVKVYGIQQATPVDETTHPTPQTHYARTKLAGEIIVQASSIDTVILRLSAVFGPRLKGSWQRLIHAIQAGWYRPIGDGKNQRSLTYVADVAQAAIIVANHANAFGQIYNVVGYESVTMQAILTAIHGSYDKPLPILHIPGKLAILAGFMLDKGLSLIGKQSPITAKTLEEMLESEVYAGEKLRQLGFTPKMTLSESWQQTVQRMDH